MKNLVNFTLIWISQNLAIPFWIIGHVHLSTNIYEDMHEILASVGMNVIDLCEEENQILGSALADE